MAVQLNATDVHLTSNVSNFPNRSAPFSLSCWVNAIWSASGTVSMVGLYLPGTVAIQIGKRTGGQIDAWTWGGGVFISSSGVYTPSDNTWLNISYTWDSTTHRLYVNGNFITSSTTAITPGVFSLIYINGYPTGGAAETSNSLIDDVSYFNRVLSASEIQTIYTGRGARDNIYNGLVSRYCFNSLPVGATVDTIVDYSGNNNILTQSGAGDNITHALGIVDLDTTPVLG